MSGRQNIRLDQRIGMRLSQQQLRFVKLLELNAPELDDAVDVALEENPALSATDSVRNDENDLTADGERFEESAEEIQKADYSRSEEIPHYRPETQKSHRDDDRTYDFLAVDDGMTLYDYLNAQISERNLTAEIKMAAEYIVGNLDPNGYLTRSINQIAVDMATTINVDLPMEKIDEAMKVVRSLEPHGVGASNLQECLLLQIEAMPDSEDKRDAYNIIKYQFEAFSMKHTHRIISGLKLNEDRLKKAVSLILSLNPKPGAVIGSGMRQTARSIIPDFIVNVDEGEISVQLNNRIPELKIEESFENAVKRMEANGLKRESRKGKEFILSRYNEARDFIAILKQRQETLFSVMTAIVKIQKNYFLSEDVHALRPMMMKDIAVLTGFDLSVISRATNNKYVATPWGIFPLRFFFSDSMGKEGDQFTNREIEAEIRQLVEKEDKKHPLSDEKLRLELSVKGYELSRRTIAKYRDRLKIPVARLRKKL